MDFPFQMLKTLSALALVLGLLWGATFAFRRWGPTFLKGSDKEWIHILERRYLGPKHSLLLVRVAEETLLLGVSPQGLTYLTAVGLESHGQNNVLAAKDSVP